MTAPMTPAEVEALRAENERLREAHKALHRRCQSAESGLAAALANRDGQQGPSFGRALANAAATLYRAQLDEYREAVRDHLRHCTGPADTYARLRALAERDTPPAEAGKDRTA